MSHQDDNSTVKSLYDEESLESFGAHMFFGEVDPTTAYACSEFILKSNLYHQHSKPLTIFFNTCGGDCSDGFAVIDVMETSRLPIATVGIGQQASMGVLLLAAGTKGMRTITSNSEVMAHQFSAALVGKQHELISSGRGLKHLEERFYRHFLRHSNLSRTQIKDILFSSSDRYLTPSECKKYGLVDRVVDSSTAYTQLGAVKKKKKRS